MVTAHQDFRKAGDFWGKQIASGIESAKDFNRNHGLLSDVRTERFQ